MFWCRGWSGLVNSVRVEFDILSSNPIGRIFARVEDGPAEA
jgi:hypothetical protein